MKIYCFLSLEQHGIPVFCCYPYLFSIRSGRLFHMPTKVAVLSEEESSAFGKLEVQSSQQWELRFCCLSSSVFLPEVCVEDLRCCLGLASLLPAANCSEKEASDVGVLTALNFLCRLIVVLLWVSVPSVFFTTTGEKKSTGRACFWNAWSLSKMSS